jgi:hypothetical protein
MTDEPVVRRGGNMRYRYKRQVGDWINTLLEGLMADETLSFKVSKEPNYWRVWWEITAQEEA